METTAINGIEYYKADDVYSKNPAYFYGCVNNPRNIIAKKNLSDDNYLYAYTKDNKLVLSNKTYCRAKLFLSKTWVDNNVKGIDDTKDVNDIVNDVEMGPPEIKLEDGEYFTDCNDNEMKIKIRGDREKKEFYFSVQDVAKCFELPNLEQTIMNTNSSYLHNEHYKYFSFIGKINDLCKKTRNKFTYLTYTGLIRCLYVSRSKNADKFQKWATNILFMHQFGSITDKIKLSSKLLGVTSEAVKQVCKASTSPISCIYLFTLGTVKDLRESMSLDDKYSDNMIICKYGKTDSLERRTSEHVAKFGPIDGCNLMLKYYSYIDPQYMTDAENYIRDNMNAIKSHITYEDNKELIAIDKKTLDDKIKMHYGMVEKAFAGNISELQNKIRDLENKLTIENGKHKIELLEKDKQIDDLKNKHIILGKDKELEDLKNRHEVELLKMELEFMKKYK